MKRLLVLAALATAVVVLAGGCHDRPSHPAEPLLDEAEELRVAGDYQAAIEAFQNLRDQYPGSWYDSHAEEMMAVAYVSWSRDLKKENDYALAIEKLETMVAQCPDTDIAQDATGYELPFAYTEWAQYLVLEKHDYQSAVEKYELIIARYPKTEYDYAGEAREKIPWCFQSWGDYLYDEGNYAGAMEKYSLVLEGYADSEVAAELRQSADILDCYYGLAQQAEETGEFDAAIGHYEAVLEHWPQSWRADSVKRSLAGIYLVKAAQLEGGGQWGEAYQIYQKYLDRLSDEVGLGSQVHDVKFELLPQCAYQYGKTLENEGRYQEAIEIYQIARLTEDEEAIPRCYYLWVQQLQAGGKYDEAVGNYITILSDYPDAVWASWEKGEILAGIPAECLYDHAVKLGVSENALRLYQAILDYHDESGYTAETVKAIVDIGMELILGGEHGILPSATSEGTVAAGGTAVIEVRNGTPYTLLVLFKGQDTEVVYLRPHPDATEYFILPLGGITRYTSEEISLGPGEYQIGAKVSQRGISPWYGEDSFAGDERYSQIFYIKVSFG